MGASVGGSAGWPVVALVDLLFPKSIWILEMASSCELHVMAGRSARTQVRMEITLVMRSAGVRDGWLS